MDWKRNSERTYTRTLNRWHLTSTTKAVFMALKNTGMAFTLNIAVIKCAHSKELDFNFSSTFHLLMPRLFFFILFYLFLTIWILKELGVDVTTIILGQNAIYFTYLPSLKWTLIINIIYTSGSPNKFQISNFDYLFYL